MFNGFDGLHWFRSSIWVHSAFDAVDGIRLISLQWWSINVIVLRKHNDANSKFVLGMANDWLSSLRIQLLQKSHLNAVKRTGLLTTHISWKFVEWCISYEIRNRQRPIQCFCSPYPLGSETKYTKRVNEYVNHHFRQTYLCVYHNASIC